MAKMIEISRSKVSAFGNSLRDSYPQLAESERAKAENTLSRAPLHPEDIRSLASEDADFYGVITRKSVQISNDIATTLVTAVESGVEDMDGLYAFLGASKTETTEDIAHRCHTWQRVGNFHSPHDMVFIC